MPWLVSIRISGQFIGARATTATRRSVIFSAEGFELVLVFCGSASSVWSAQKPAPITPAAPFKKERRPPDCCFRKDFIDGLLRCHKYISMRTASAAVLVQVRELPELRVQGSV